MEIEYYPIIFEIRIKNDKIDVFIIMRHNIVSSVINRLIHFEVFHIFVIQ